MKNLFLLTALLICAGGLNAQTCIIDSSRLQTPGVYPAANAIPCITAGVYYTQTLQGLIETGHDTAMFGTQIHVDVDSIRFDSIVGLPAGIFWAQSPTVLRGGGYGCINFSGVTNQAPGTYPITAYGIAWTRISSSSMTDTPYVFNGDLGPYSHFGGYYLTICAGTPTVILGPDRTVCAGSQLILNPTVTGGVQPYTYQWAANGDTLSCNNCKNPAAVLTQNSVYSVTVIDANNNQTTNTISYTITGTSSTVQLGIGNTHIDCTNPQGTTTVTVTSGVVPYTFNWGDGTITNGQLPQQHNYPNAGDYIIGITDANGCVNEVLNTILFNGITITGTPPVLPNCTNQNTGTLGVTATGGTAPYTYAWSTGAVTSQATNIPAGNYAVTVTDATGCSSIAHFNLAPANGWGYYVYAQASATNCNNNGTITTTTYAGNAPFSYIWNNGSTNVNLTGLAGGVYTLTVTDATGCSATGQAIVPSNCYSIISGNIFADANSNCVKENTETAVTDLYVIATGNGQNYFGYTDANGNYSIQVPTAGTYNLMAGTYYYNICTSVNLCNNSNHTVTIATLGDTSANNNFTMASGTGFDLGVFMRWTAGNPGFTKTYRLYPFNRSGIGFNGQASLTFTYDSNLIYQTSSIPAVHDLVNHTLTWAVDSLPPQWNFVFNTEIIVEFLVPVNTSLSTILNSNFYVSPTTGDCDSTNNNIQTTDLVTGSFDPNEKKVEPAGRILEEDSILTYTIGFQNTGTDSTHFIILKDTLSPLLDAASVRNIASSHAYTEFNISGQGILTWTFNPLRLVDSFTNEPESHGFVKFTIKKQRNIPIGGIISNRAHIYFDYNEPVITNTVADTLSEPTYIFEALGSNNVSVRAYPNPFSDYTTIAVEGLSTGFNFCLFDISGQLVKQLPNVQSNTFTMPRNELAPGIYFYRLTATNGQMAFGKLVAR